MKIGLQIYHFDWPGGLQNISSKLNEIAATAEKSGFSSLWVMDHLYQLGGAFGSVDAPLLEAYSTLSYLAAGTKKVNLGVLVTNNVCRYPGILVKIVSTLDVLSNGRMYLGIGLGGQVKREIEGFGIPTYPQKEQIDRLEETLRILHHIWRGDRSPFMGKCFQMKGPLNNPQPLSKPHPPILIGMWEGGKRMMRLTAKYADACNLQFGSPLPEFAPWMRERFLVRKEFLQSRLALLRASCSEFGRSYENIERTVLGTIKIAPNAMTARDVIELCKEFAQLGFQHVIFNMPNVHEVDPVRIIGEEVIPEVKNL
jgi:alkanesulfonate monooxygenase SsuD/methylene tetrahydromethanopterin reductase-like flavin-dependent oxidoreductase (luciferase family)